MKPKTIKKVKAWAAIWGEIGSESFGVPLGQIICVEPKDEIKIDLSKKKVGRPIYRYTEPLAIFENESEARAFVAGNVDWDVTELTITYSIPKKNK